MARAVLRRTVRMHSNPGKSEPCRAAGAPPFRNFGPYSAIEVALDESRRAGCWDTRYVWRGAPFGGSLQLELSSGARVLLSIPPLTREVIVVGGHSGPHEVALALAGFVEDEGVWIHCGAR